MGKPTAWGFIPEPVWHTDATHGRRSKMCQSYCAFGCCEFPRASINYSDWLRDQLGTTLQASTQSPITGLSSDVALSFGEGVQMAVQTSTTGAVVGFADVAQAALQIIS